MELKNFTDFKSLVIKLASPEKIGSWSRGEVTKPETINYRTLKPEKDGLFDERIFGPTKDWECYCGKYKRIRYRGTVCDKCGVEVTQSRVRRERMGHINLASPVAHVWFFKGAPSKVSLLLDLPPKVIEQVIYFARYLVLEVDEKKQKKAQSLLEKLQKEKIAEIKTDFADRSKEVEEDAEKEVKQMAAKVKDKEQQALAREEIELEKRKRLTRLLEEERVTREKTEQLFEKIGELVASLQSPSFLSEDEYAQLAEQGLAIFFTAKMGAEAVLKAIGQLNLEELSAQLRKEAETTTGARNVKVTKRLSLVNGLRRAGIDPSWMVLRVLPVLPPDLRPMVQLSGGRFATSDLNDLYRRVINRNNRLRHLLELGAPEIILRNEKRMLQEAVDSLIDASQRQATRRGRGRQPLRSLSDMLRGKQGRFRQNLLGKRVDYSGRSVIVVGPELQLSQCGLPKEIALEMFKPFVLREMIETGIAPNVKSAKNMLERRPPEIFDLLEKITQRHPVLLNRAPTLHKLGILAFYPVLVEGSAIRIHPCVCPGYNADFDGDQMAVHVPLTSRAQEEAVELMMPEHNLLKPADGSPIAIPATKEMALGVFYLTKEIKGAKEDGEAKIFADEQEAIFAYQAKKIDLRELIKVKIGEELLETTVGRVLFNEVIPEWLRFINEPVTSGILRRMFSLAFARGSMAEVVEMIDKIKDLGFSAATVSGISFGIVDAELHPEKKEMIEVANKQVAEKEQNFRQGLITEEEKKRLVKEIWIEATEDLADRTWEKFAPTNPIKMIIDAGVGRASRDQVKQIAAMRGLVVDPLGKIVELPTKSNFREGLSVFEYVATARGSRKGVTDKAIKTADAGYLTRRLVDVAHDVIVRLEDCETSEGLVIRRKDRPKTFLSRVLGRTLVEDLQAPGKKKGLAKKGEEIDDAKLEVLEDSGVEEVKARSPLTCQARYGVCATCFGWDLSTKKRVEVGTPVGVVAAQAIGEPGTQLTMRTFHRGGLVGIDVTQGLPRVEELLEARVPKAISPLAEISGKVEVVETEDVRKVRIKTVNVKPAEEKEYIVPKTARLLVSDGQLLERGAQLVGGSLDIKEILAIRGLRAAQEYLITETQKVYESQGVPINDRHFEVIVRKMSDNVRVVTQGDTTLLSRDLVAKATFEEENEKVLAEGGEPATAQVVILGITRTSLRTESWLSAASFQMTTNVLTDSALLGKEDGLLGLKENVIIGRLIPVTPELAQLPEQKGLPS